MFIRKVLLITLGILVIVESVYLTALMVKQQRLDETIKSLKVRI